MSEAPSPFCDIEEAIEEIRAGRMVVVVDSPDRENEGDLCMAAEFVSADAFNFMATHGRGLICLTLTPETVTLPFSIRYRWTCSGAVKRSHRPMPSSRRSASSPTPST
ncbi:MAG: 3,4-dihydroxy 2-butanone 4-phosphate synthase / cyclohydrolase, partial [Gaiellales bacterium]|nr:3,4-dihydroxy 2-butanone 4-phosphate synthase / cyclohydrolase [Gaiellales bacterium]